MFIRRDKAIKYFKLAKFNADLFSKDPSKKVGAIFLAPHSLQVKTFGYNGFPRDIDETLESRWVKPAKNFFVEHAERNGIYNACRHGTPLENSICIVTMFPCAECARALIQVGVKCVVSVEPNIEDETWGEQFKKSLLMFAEANISVIYLHESEV